MIVSNGDVMKNVSPVIEVNRQYFVIQHTLLLNEYINNNEPATPLNL